MKAIYPFHMDPLVGPCTITQVKPKLIYCVHMHNVELGLESGFDSAGCNWVMRCEASGRQWKVTQSTDKICKIY